MRIIPYQDRLILLIHGVQHTEYKVTLMVQENIVETENTIYTLGQYAPN